MRRHAPAVLLLAALMLGGSAASADTVRVVDDTGHEVALTPPARRIISLAPNITEMLFAAGAGDRLVATVDYSDHPPAALEIPRIGSSERLDLEAILDHEPDLVIGWDSGNPRGQVERLRELGVDVYMTESRRPADIARILERMGRLAGTSSVAEPVARDFLARFEQLRARYGDRDPIGVFYQIWDEPMMTVNGRHMISAIIDGCGGFNVFSDLSSLAPRIDVEAVVARDPEVIVASGPDAEPPQWLDDWQDWSGLKATAMGNLYSVPPDIIQRQTPRILDGMERLCRHLEEARQKR